MYVYNKHGSHRSVVIVLETTWGYIWNMGNTAKIPDKGAISIRSYRSPGVRTNSNK